MHTLQNLSYYVQTFGCQMNEHDSERVAGVLEAAGALPAETIETADIAVFMTCCVREKADTHLYARAQALKSAPLPKSGKRTVCLGGCIAQRDGKTLSTHVPIARVIFGTQAIPSLVGLIEKARTSNTIQVDIAEPNQGFTSDLPTHPVRNYSAWVPIMCGCNNFCSYCIVPYVRGRERSREMHSILAEIEQLVEQGTQEVTLLGQNVNSYGPTLSSRPTFAKLLEEVANIGIPRIRFTSSHPKDLTDEIIEVMAQHENIMPHLHLAAQSGSSAVLRDMNRRYTREHYINLSKKLKSAIPHLALTTDLIVGFPTETEEDFEQTLTLIDEAHIDSAYTFIYSKRPHTPAARMSPVATKEEIAARFDRLVEKVAGASFAYNKTFEDRYVEVLVEGYSKKDSSVLTGHSKENIPVHFSFDSKQAVQNYIGTLQTIRVEQAQTWYLKGALS